MVPVINKIDLPSADPERVIEEIENIIGIEATDAVRVSAKTGENVPQLLEELVRRIPPPKGDTAAPLQALIVDSWFDNYVGVVSLVRVMNGVLRPNDRIQVMSTGRGWQVDRVGRFTPKRVATDVLSTGEVGWMTAGIRDIDGAPVGDTITSESRPCEKPLPGFKMVQPRVFAGMFPVQSDQYESFRDALQKLKLNDSALHYEPEVSTALGFGFRCGFLGLLHMDIVQERLEREYGLSLVTSAPTVIYEVLGTDGEVSLVDNPSKLPPNYRELREPNHHGEYPGAAGARRWRAGTLPGEARRAEEDAAARHPDVAAVPAAACRSRARLLRPPEIREPRLCLVRLRVQPLPGRAALEARHHDQRRPRGCAVDDRAP